MSCFKGGQFYVIPSFDDMPVGTAQCILEHCKIGVHGTTGFHFSPSFLIVRFFLLVSEVQSVCENVALPFVTPMHTPLHNHSINNCGFKTSDPFCSPWRNKHQILFCPLSTLFFNIRISAVVSSYPRSSRTRPNISQIALQPGKGGAGRVRWVERMHHHKDLQLEQPRKAVRKAEIITLGLWRP